MISETSEQSPPPQPRTNYVRIFIYLFLYFCICIAAFDCIASTALFRTYIKNLSSTAWGGFIAPVYPLTIILYGLFLAGGDISLYSRGKRKLVVLLLIGPPIGIVMLFAVTYFLSGGALD